VTEPQQQEESFMSHLVELRDRIVKSVAAILVLFVICFYFSKDIMDLLLIPLRQSMPAGTKAISVDAAGQFFTLTKIAFLSAGLLSLPWVLYQVWSFVSPGLYDHEKRFGIPLIFSSVFFMSLGIAFAYFFVISSAYKFFFDFAKIGGVDQLQDTQKYWDFILSIFFGFGLTFEVPVVQMLLVKLGMVTPQQLKEARRYVIVGAFIVAAVLTPPDFISQFMLAIPLCLLYELGIFLSGFVKARSARPSEKPEDAPASSDPTP
jgi:sec-independent protein translocase protein TatC